LGEKLTETQWPPNPALKRWGTWVEAAQCCHCSYKWNNEWSSGRLCPLH